MMKKRMFVVVGLGRFGYNVARTLFESGAEVLAIDLCQELVESMRDFSTQAVQADAMDQNVLITLGVRDCDVAIVSIGNDVKASGVITMQMKELGVGKVIAKAHDEVHGRMLQKLGADKVIYPERDSARSIAHNLVNGNILNFIEVSPDFSLSEIAPMKEWCGNTLAELDLRKRLGVNVVAIRTGDSVNASPAPETVIFEGDVLLVLAGEATLRKIRESR